MQYHWITLRIHKESEGKSMTEDEVKSWVEDHFAGCDYGKVEVKDAVNIEVVEQ